METLTRGRKEWFVWYECDLYICSNFPTVGVNNLGWLVKNTSSNIYSFLCLFNFLCLKVSVKLNMHICCDAYCRGRYSWLWLHNEILWYDINQLTGAHAEGCITSPTIRYQPRGSLQASLRTGFHFYPKYLTNSLQQWASFTRDYLLLKQTDGQGRHVRIAGVSVHGQYS